MATGEPPFTAASPTSVMKMHLSPPLPWPRARSPQVDPGLEAVIVRCLEKEKRSRYPDMRALADALGEASGLDVGPYFGEDPHPDAPPLPASGPKLKAVGQPGG